MFTIYAIITLLIILIVYLIFSLNHEDSDDFVEGTIITESR